MTDQIAVGMIHPGDFEFEQILSVEESYAYDVASGSNVLAWPPIRNQSGVDLAKGRNEVVAAFLERSTAEWLMFVDTDMGWAPDAIHRLRASADPEHRPVVGGLCFGFKRAALSPERAWRYNLFPTIYEFVERDHEVGFHAAGEWKRDGLNLVAGTGAAFLLIHRRILEAIAERYGPNQWFTQLTHPKGPTIFSEDLSFCVRVAGVDAPLYVDASVKTSHKKVAYLDEWLFDNLPRIKPPMPKAVVTGTGRCGTQYAAEVLRALGVATSHEELFTPEGYDYSPGFDVAVSWLAVPELDELDDDAQVVHLTRDPLAVVRSLVGIGFFDPDDEAAPLHERYVRFVRRNLPDLPDDPTLAAMRFVVEWSRRIEPYAAERVQVEDFPWGRVLKRLGHRRTKAQIAEAVEAVGHGVNHRPRADLTWSTLPEGPERDDLAQLAKDYGYEVDL